MRPLGADASIGVTKSTTSSLSSMPSNSPTLDDAVFARAATASLSLFIFSPVLALTLTASGSSPASRVRSHLLKTTRNGIFFSRIFSRSSLSPRVKPFVASATSSATSHLSSSTSVLLTLIEPSSPPSSAPAVSTSVTAPTGKSSIALTTGSVVVPGVSLTIDTSCPAKALTRLDLPALRLPKKPMRTLFALGAEFKLPINPPLKPEISFSVFYLRNVIRRDFSNLFVWNFLQFVFD